MTSDPNRPPTSGDSFPGGPDFPMAPTLPPPREITPQADHDTDEPTGEGVVREPFPQPQLPQPP
jgi:hypothetical protein